MKRKNGFYWVKIYSGKSNWRWVVTEFEGNYWFFQGCRYDDENFQEIDERRIERQT